MNKQQNTGAGRALYRTYRSRSLDEVVGQEHITRLLARALANNTVAHAYLFTGPRGVGKTSIARILAHEINGLVYDDDATHLDIIEIDAASNNGVDDIRDLRDKVQLAPVSAGKKVYIIDEVHMLSKPAFNALLKTLEEPPEHVVFILATTDIDKVPDTIISRTQRWTFRRASEADIIKNLQRIAKAEKIKAEPSALELIAVHADGSFRDSVSLFDQLSSSADDKGLTHELVASSLGLAQQDTIDTLIDAARNHDTATIVQTVDTLEANGTPARIIVGQLVRSLRSRVADEPELAKLIDQLLEVNKSSHPHLKLLTVLSLFSPNERGVEPSPARVTRGGAAPSSNLRDEGADNGVPTKPVSWGSGGVAGHESSDLRGAAKGSSDDGSGGKDEVAADSEPTRKALATPPAFDWSQLIAQAQKSHVALYSVLSKCEHNYSDGVLTVYTKSAFYKKKLDDPKYRSHFNQCLNEIGAAEVEIRTVPGGSPMKDSHAAKVADIMGGGEEVSVE